MAVYIITYRVGENWKPEFLYFVIFIIDTIYTYVTTLMAFRMYVELSKYIY